jgi:hypothetical protein
MGLGGGGWMDIGHSINHFLAANIGQFEFGFVLFLSDCSPKHFRL